MSKWRRYITCRHHIDGMGTEADLLAWDEMDRRYDDIEYSTRRQVRRTYDQKKSGYDVWNLLWRAFAMVAVSVMAFVAVVGLLTLIACILSFIT